MATLATQGSTYAQARFDALSARTLLKLLRQVVDAPLPSLDTAKADDLRLILHALIDASDIHIICDDGEFES